MALKFEADDMKQYWKKNTIKSQPLFLELKTKNLKTLAL
jgi:hypothetical protein